MDTWAMGRMVGVDVESTGTDTETDRVVTVTLTDMFRGAITDSSTWMIDPGIEIPAEAAEVHGITTERARREGRPPREALDEFGLALRARWGPDTPLVAYNAPYDLSILDAEFRRHGGYSLWQQVHTDSQQHPVVDPLVCDRWADRWRKGGRKLTDVAAHYRVELKDAHTSEADTAAALHVAVALARKYPKLIGDRSLPDLHKSQTGWHRTWSLRMSAFLRSEFAKMDQAAQAAFRGSPSAQQWVREKLTKLELVTPDVKITRALVEQAQWNTAQRAEDFARIASEWPVRAHTSRPVDSLDHPQGVDAPVDNLAGS